MEPPSDFESMSDSHAGQMTIEKHRIEIFLADANAFHLATVWPGPEEQELENNQIKHASRGGY